MNNTEIKSEMSDRPTPETDAMAVTCYGESGIENSFGFLAVPIKDCRKLERERDEWAALCGQYKAERDEAREVLKTIASWQGGLGAKWPQEIARDFLASHTKEGAK